MQRSELFYRVAHVLLDEVAVVGVEETERALKLDFGRDDVVSVAALEDADRQHSGIARIGDAAHVLIELIQ